MEFSMGFICVLLFAMAVHGLDVEKAFIDNEIVSDLQLSSAPKKALDVSFSMFKFGIAMEQTNVLNS